MELVKRIRADNNLFEKLVQHQLLSSILVQYRIVGNLGNVFNLAKIMVNSVQIAKLETHKMNLMHVCLPMTVSIYMLIAKFKFCEYQWRAILPKLMLITCVASYIY